MITQSVTLHGDPWLLSDIAEDVAWIAQRSWQLEKWLCGPALIHKKGGTVSYYRGQKFDPNKINLVQEGWSHDHCLICNWTLHETNDNDSGVGFTDANGGWLCQECYTKLIKPKMENKSQ